ncbi:isochorismatase family protein [Roseibium algae]|uniref:Isochorismatase family protein n=1 Tax=Roseibium algae TaxID=3123038 RepID=A0ABU8TPT3_9HYPH
MKNLIVGGFMSHMCVSSPVRASLDLGFSATVIASACASRVLPAPIGGVLSGEMVHKVAMAALADRFSAMLPDVSFI